MNGVPLFAPDPMTRMTMRDVLTPLFRRSRLVILTFSGILLGTILFSVLWAGRFYEAKMQVLVEQNRSDPAITSMQNAAVMSRVITPDEISSEIALLSGHDCSWRLPTTAAWRITRLSETYSLPRDPTQRKAAKLEKAAVSLAKASGRVEAEKTSDVINVTYGSTGSPETPLCVLSTLASSMSRSTWNSSGQRVRPSFSPTKLTSIGQELAEAEARLVDFGRDQGNCGP